MTEINNQTDLDTFLQQDFSTKVLCPTPSEKGSLLDFATPLIDLLNLEFALVNDKTLLVGSNNKKC